MSETKNSKRSDAGSKKDKSNKKDVAVKNKGELKVAAQPKNEVKKVDSKAKAQNVKVSSSSPFDKVLWLLSFALLALAIGGNYYYTQYVMVDETSLMRLGRVGIVIAIIALGLGVLLFTTTGKRLLAYGRDSYTELRKVVWPTRQESIQTTVIVFIAVSVVSLFLYLCDLLFLQIVRVITL